MIESQEADFEARTASVKTELEHTQAKVASLEAELAKVTGVADKVEKEKAAQEKLNRLVHNDSMLRDRVEGLVTPIVGQIA